MADCQVLFGGVGQARPAALLAERALPAPPSGSRSRPQAGADGRAAFGEAEPGYKEVAQVADFVPERPLGLAPRHPAFAGNDDPCEVLVEHAAQAF